MQRLQQLRSVCLLATLSSLLALPVLANQLSSPCGSAPKGGTVHDKALYESCMSQSGEAKPFIEKPVPVPVPGGAVAPKPGQAKAEFTRCVKTKIRQYRISVESARENCSHLR